MVQYIDISNKNRNTLGDAINMATQGFIQGQQLRRQGRQDNLAQAKNQLEMKKLNMELGQMQNFDPSTDLVADPQGTGMFYSRSQGKWINPKAQSTNINLGGILGGAFEEQEQPQGRGASFNSVEEADNSGLPAGTRVMVNGRPYEI